MFQLLWTELVEGDGTKVRRGTEAKHQHDFVGTPRSFLDGRFSSPEA